MGGPTEIADHEDVRERARLVIEAAHFDPVAIARRSRRHKLSSEASRRFERAWTGLPVAPAHRRPAGPGSRAHGSTGHRGRHVPRPHADIIVPANPRKVAVYADCVPRSSRSARVYGGRTRS